MIRASPGARLRSMWSVGLTSWYRSGGVGAEEEYSELKRGVCFPVAVSGVGDDVHVMWFGSQHVTHPYVLENATKSDEKSLVSELSEEEVKVTMDVRDRDTGALLYRRGVDDHTTFWRHGGASVVGIREDVHPDSLIAEFLGECDLELVIHRLGPDAMMSASLELESRARPADEGMQLRALAQSDDTLPSTMWESASGVLGDVEGLVEQLLEQGSDARGGEQVEVCGYAGGEGVVLASGLGRVLVAVNESLDDQDLGAPIIGKTGVFSGIVEGVVHEKRGDVQTLAVCVTDVEVARFLAACEASHFATQKRSSGDLEGH